MEKKGAQKLVQGDPRKGKTVPVSYWNYLEAYWPCAGELSAVNAIATYLRDPILKLGTDPIADDSIIDNK